MVEETTFRKLKKALIEMLKGYPEFGYFGKVEFFLQTREKAVNVLLKHEIIEELPKEEVMELSVPEEQKKYRWYRLKPRGVELAMSMINLEYNESVLKYNKTMKKLTIWIIVLSILTLSFWLVQLFFNLPLFDITSLFR